MTKPKPPKLKPCPFCGTKPAIGYLIDGTTWVYCDSILCLMSPVTKDFRSESIATKAWNTRKAPK